MIWFSNLEKIHIIGKSVKFPICHFKHVIGFMNNKVVFQHFIPKFEFLCVPFLNYIAYGREMQKNGPNSFSYFSVNIWIFSKFFSVIVFWRWLASNSRKKFGNRFIMDQNNSGLPTLENCWEWDSKRCEGAKRPSPTERSEGGGGCGAFSFLKVKLCDLVHTL